VWDQYAARDLHERPPDPNLKEVMKGGGRGYYRPTSLLSAWAYAPFMHNDAIGPEQCGKPSSPAVDFYESPYVDKDGKPVADAPPCWAYDPSVEGRWKLYKASMDDLLHPDRRTPKMFIIGDDIIVDVAPKLRLGSAETGLSLRVPKGVPAVALNSLRFKDLIQDLVLSDRDPAKLTAKYQGILPPDRLKTLQEGLARLRATLLKQAGTFTLDITAVEGDFIQSYYSNVLERVENAGHRFGENLSEREKQALIAFVATL
jgi:hypothetical protein